MKKCPNRTDCKDKDSTHYFSSHMTQEEFEERIKHLCPDGKTPPFKFNELRKLRGEK